MSRILPSARPDERLAHRINDAAALAGLSRSTLYELMKTGKLHTIKIGGRRLIPADALRELLQGQDTGDSKNAARDPKVTSNGRSEPRRYGREHSPASRPSPKVSDMTAVG